MSINSTCSSETQNDEVQSKYFIDSKDNTDDSISDFKESKKGIKGPKTAAVAPKTKRKHSKRPRGQKDIRTALKSKKNDLIAFSKDFDAVCKQSGLDVDAEQLQLAIALSKSLQSNEGQPESSSKSSQPCTSQERVGKIRKTLQEYGFKVPEVKINTASTKRGRKRRKESKLLLVTEVERQQTITDRYSQVLFENVVKSNILQSEKLEKNEDTIYHLATNISYEALKDNKLFYVKELLDNTTSTIGSLLRDWSKIPGRPLSPVQKSQNVKFEKMSLTLEEFDTILSGSVLEAQEIVKSKNLEDSDIELDLIDGDSNDTLEVQEMMKKPEKNRSLLEIPQTQTRSYSPDLFDDELSSIDNTKETIASIKALSQSCSQIVSQKSKPNVTRRKTNDFMDLTECVNVFSLPGITKNKSTFSVDSPEVKDVNIKSNSQQSDDLMEITDCVAVNSESIITKKVYELLNSQKSDDMIEITESTVDPNAEDNIDLTQDSDNKEEHILANVPVDKTILNIIDEENIDLTQSDNSGDDTLPLVHISGHKPGSFIEDVNLINSDENLGLLRLKEDSPFKNKRRFININPHDKMDNISSKKDSLENHGTIGERNYTSLKQDSIFDEFIFEHSDHKSSKDTEAKVSDNSENIHVGTDICEDNNIDLTQNSDSSKHSTLDEVLTTVHDVSSLGKRDDVSIDYDEVYLNETVENIHKKQNKIWETNMNNPNTLQQIDDVSRDYDEVYMNQTLKHNMSNATEELKNDNLNMRYSKAKEIEANKGFGKDITQNYYIANNVDDYIDIVNDHVQFYMSFKEDQTPAEAENSTSSNKISTPEVFDQPSQEVFEISDEELNYSIHKSKYLMNNSQSSQEHNIPDDNPFNFDLGGISILHNITSLQNSGKNCVATSVVGLHKSANESFLKSIEINGTRVKIKSPTTNSKSEATTPTKELNKTYSSVQTPNNTEYLIKTSNVTPMLDYASMTTPDRNKELEKYGLKPFKRKRAIQLLTHLYTQTHPVIENLPGNDQPSPSKKRKQSASQKSPNKLTERTPKKYISKSPRKFAKSPREYAKTLPKSSCSKTTMEDVLEKENIDEISSVAVIRDIDCSPDDWVFQKREKAKVHSCRVPLHVAFHNYVASRRCLREAILRYEPVNIDVIHKDLVSYGHRYDPKDLLRFLDKKCITVKTVDNNGRNTRKS